MGKIWKILVKYSKIFEFNFIMAAQHQLSVSAYFLSKDAFVRASVNECKGN